MLAITTSRAATGLAFLLASGLILAPVAGLAADEKGISGVPPDRPVETMITKEWQIPWGLIPNDPRAGIVATNFPERTPINLAGRETAKKWLISNAHDSRFNDQRISIISLNRKPLTIVAL